MSKALLWASRWSTSALSVDAAYREGLRDAHDCQDFKDGVALRQLREALPGQSIVITMDRVALGDGVTISISRMDEGEGYVAYEATIAEAADKCREALER